MELGGLEIVGFIVIMLGGLLALAGWIWLVVLGFQKGGALWGILNIFCQPITGIIFCIMHKTGWIPLALVIVGSIVQGIGFIPLAPAYIKMLERMN